MKAIVAHLGPQPEPAKKPRQPSVKKPRVKKAPKGITAAPSEAWRVAAEISSDVSDEHVRAVGRWMARHDPEIVEVAALRGGRLAVYNQITEDPSMADLRDERPRGHPPGVTWANLSGVAAGKRAIVGALGDSVADDANRLGAVAAHEFGHAIDATFSGGRFSNTNEFMAAYRNARDTDNDGSNAIRRWRPDNADYFEQDGNAGPQEFWAEVWSELHNPYGDGPDVIEYHFPGLGKLMSRMVRDNYGLR